MADELDVIVCQRCGRGFVLTDTYRDYLLRWGRRIIVPVLCPTCFYGAGPQPKQEGKVKWFSPRKHYGFIALEEDRDVFFHQRQLLKGVDEVPQEGQVVRFHTRHSPKGLEAVNVEIKG